MIEGVVKDAVGADIVIGFSDFHVTLTQGLVEQRYIYFHSQGRTYLYQAVTRRASICLVELVAFILH